MSWTNLTFVVGQIFTSQQANDLQENIRQARIHHYGSSPPGTLEPGLEWWDTSGTYPVKRVYDGANWIPFLFFDSGTNEAGVTPSGDAWGTFPMVNVGAARTDFSGPLFFPRNMLLNGGMTYWQRGSSYSVQSFRAYTADRWMVEARGSFTINIRQSVSNPDTSPARVSYQIQIANQQSALNAAHLLQIVQPVEGLTLLRALYGSATPRLSRGSAWVWCGVTGRFSWYVANASRTVVQTGVCNIPVASVWTQVEFPILPPAAGAGPWASDTGVGAWFGITLLAGTNFRCATPNAWIYNSPDVRCVSGQLNLATASGTTFRLTDIQWEMGQVASPFDTLPGAIELEMLRRYYLKTFDLSVAPRDGTGQIEGALVDMGSDVGHMVTRWPFLTRAAPIITFYNPRSGPSAAPGCWLNHGNQTDSKLGIVLSYGDSGIMVSGSGSGVGSENKKLMIHATAEAELF